jgi:monovalent cation:H+ antiporter-2, CPA2 family
MHASAEFLHSFAAVFCVAALSTLVCTKLRLPPILALLVAGMLVGAHGPQGAIASDDTVASLSELGIIFLMFTIGLELRFSKLAALGFKSVCIALSGVSFMLLLSYSVSSALGFSPLLALFCAASLSISSTMVVTRVLDAKADAAPLRKSLLGILVIEDVLAMLMIAALTLIGKSANLDGAELLLTLGRLSGFLLALVLFGALIVPRMLRTLARRERNDVFIVLVLGVCFAAVLATQAFGYPSALGAFVAGSLCAESGEARRIESLTLPLKDVFSAVFFVSIGMAIDPAQLWQLLPWILLLSGLVVLGKSLGVALGFFLTGHSIRAAVSAGLNMGQTGEFGLVIAVLGASLGVGDAFLFPVAASVAALTMVLTPWLAKSSPTIANFFDARLPRRLQSFAALYGSWVERLSQRSLSPARTRQLIRRVVQDALLLLLLGALAGFFIDDVSRLLRERTELTLNGVRAVIYALFSLLLVPIGLGLWRSIRALGNELALRALPGRKLSAQEMLDAPDRAEPDLAQAPRKVFVLVLQLAIWLLVSVPILALLQPLFPNMPLALLLLALFAMALLGFWRSTGELHSHSQAGSFAVLEAFKHITQSEGAAATAIEPAHVSELLPGLGNFYCLSLPDSHTWVGQSLAQVNLRGLSGANVIAIIRPAGDVASPDGKVQLMAGDSLVLAGAQEAIDAARALHGRDGAER